jgi:hypothetical protein
MFEWLYSGVNFNLDGNGGETCSNYLSTKQKIIESLFLILISLIEIIYPWKRHVVNYKPNLELRERFGRKLLLASLCLIWGIEIGYKLSSRQLIFILNPCHVATMIQVSDDVERKVLLNHFFDFLVGTTHFTATILGPCVIPIIELYC